MPESEFVEAFTTAHGDLIESAEVLRSKRASMLVKREAFIDAAKALRDEFGFKLPVSGGAIDYPKEDRIQMVYYLMHPEERFILIYRVDLPREDLKLPTLTQVWEAMSFHEREAHEMFGIEFEGHPNMIPLLLPPDWKGGHPLRKDFKGEGVEE
ncbi:MAG: NADH-quinone oxidoreductase subunit C [Candidatus Bathyarchaeota archaeon]|nr:MAG: NADH-quinone oxidoreductase subunit C [Candidatus Bathyarchaeota archaeon]